MDLPADFRKPGPGAVDIERDDLISHIDAAVHLVKRHWVWDDPARAAAITRRCHPWQIGLFAIWRAHGELINGGFCQFLTNSSGELAEEASEGLEAFELRAFREPFEGAFSYFPRPISKDRLERIHLLHRRFDSEDRAFESVEDWFEKEQAREEEIATNVFEMAAPFLDPFDNHYYDLLKSSKDDVWGRASLHVPLCVFVDRHREAFFA